MTAEKTDTPGENLRCLKESAGTAATGVAAMVFGFDSQVY